jgi:putative flippase GtrA
VIFKLSQSDKVRYLLAGAWNTAFGYGVGIGFYLLLSDRFHTAIIALLVNVVAITMSFVSYKIYVFKTSGNWAGEYLRAWVVYSNIALLGIGLLWIFVDIMQINIWLAQALSILSAVVISYFGHKKFTFK